MKVESASALLWLGSVPRAPLKSFKHERNVAKFGKRGLFRCELLRRILSARGHSPDVARKSPARELSQILRHVTESGQNDCVLIFPKGRITCAGERHRATYRTRYPFGLTPRTAGVGHFNRFVSDESTTGRAKERALHSRLGLAFSAVQLEQQITRFAKSVWRKNLPRHSFVRSWLA